MMDIRYLDEGASLEDSGQAPTGSASLRSSGADGPSPLDPSRDVATEADQPMDEDVLRIMDPIGRERWKQWDEYKGSVTHQHISAWRGGFRAGFHADGINYQLRDALIQLQTAMRWCAGDLVRQHGTEFQKHMATDALSAARAALSRVSDPEHATAGSGSSEGQPSEASAQERGDDEGDATPNTSSK